MKYGELNLGQVEAIVNKLGGMEGVKRFLAGEIVAKPEGSTLLRINRTKPFDPEKFIGPGWKIVEQDERSLALSELDLSKIKLISTLKPNEEWVNGEENLTRLKRTKVVCLDAKVFQTFWENQESIPESWKKKLVFFDGTLLESPLGYRCTLCLYWDGGQWRWRSYWRGSVRHARCASAVLASS